MDKTPNTSDVNHESDSLVARTAAKCNRLEERSGIMLGYGYSMTAHFSFTTAGLIVKLFPYIPTFQFLFYRSIFLVIVNSLLMKEFKIPFYTESPRMNRFLFLRSLLGMCATTLLFTSYKLMPLSEAVVITITNPIFVGIFASIFLGEKYQWSNALTCVICMAGVICVARPPFIFGGTDEGNVHIFGSLICLAYAVVNAFVQVTMKQLSKSVDPFTTTMTFGTFSGLFFGILMALFEDPIHLRYKDSLPILLIGVTGFLGQALMTRSFLFGKASKLSICAFSRLFFSYCYDILILGSMPTVLDIIGTVLIIVGLGVNIIAKQYS